MTTLASRKTIERGYAPRTALASAVEFTDDSMQVFLTDGRTLSAPLLWFPRLRDATAAQRAEVELGGGGVGLHWPELGEDLSVANLMAGADLNPAQPIQIPFPHSNTAVNLFRDGS